MERNDHALEQNHRRGFETVAGSRCCRVHAVVRYSALALIIWTVAGVVAHLVIAIVTRSKEYTEEIERLRKDLIASQEKNGIYIDEENYKIMHTELTKQDEEIKEKTIYIEALQEELVTTLKILKSTQQVLKHKENLLEARTLSLMTANGHLHRTHKMLQDTIQECNERFVIDDQVSKEKSLPNQAYSLFEVVDEGTSDVKVLPNKMNRKRSVETTNEDLANEFRQIFKQKLVYMEDLTNKFAQEQASFCHEFKNNLGQRLEKRTEELTALSEQLSAVVTSQTSQYESLSNAFHSHTQNSQNWIEENLEMSRHFKDDMINQQRAFQDDKFLPIISSIAADLHHQAEQIRSTNTMILSKVSDQEKALRKFASSQQYAISETHLMVTSLAEQHLATLQQSQKHVSNINEAEDLLLMNIKSLKERLLSEVNSLESLVQSRENLRNATVKQLENDLSESVSLTQELHQDTERLTSEMANELESFQSSEMNNLQKWTSDIQDFTDQVLASNYDIEKKTEEVRIEVKDFQIKIQADLEDHHNVVEANLRKQSEVCTQDLRMQQHHMQNLMSSLQISADRHELILEEQRRDFQSYVQVQREAFTAQCVGINEWSQLLSKEVQQKNVDLDRFYTEEMRRDTSTGSTIKEFQYPHQLGRSSPREVSTNPFRLDELFFGTHDISLPNDFDSENKKNQEKLPSRNQNTSITRSRAELQNKKNGSSPQLLSTKPTKHPKRRSKKQKNMKSVKEKNPKN